VNRKEIYFIFRKEVVQMDALVEGLMEELNCETVFTIPLFGGIPVYESVVVEAKFRTYFAGCVIGETNR
jgi:hypothetical protein